MLHHLPPTQTNGGVGNLIRACIRLVVCAAGVKVVGSVSGFCVASIKDDNHLDLRVKECPSPSPERSLSFIITRKYLLDQIVSTPIQYLIRVIVEASYYRFPLMCFMFYLIAHQDRKTTSPLCGFVTNTFATWPK